MAEPPIFNEKVAQLHRQLGSALFPFLKGDGVRLYAVSRSEAFWPAFIMSTGYIAAILTVNALIVGFSDSFTQTTATISVLLRLLTIELPLWILLHLFRRRKNINFLVLLAALSGLTSAVILTVTSPLVVQVARPLLVDIEQIAEGKGRETPAYKALCIVPRLQDQIDAVDLRVKERPRPTSKAGWDKAIQDIRSDIIEKQGLLHEGQAILSEYNNKYKFKWVLELQMWSASILPIFLMYFVVIKSYRRNRGTVFWISVASVLASLAIFAGIAFAALSLHGGNNAAVSKIVGAINPKVRCDPAEPVVPIGAN